MKKAILYIIAICLVAGSAIMGLGSCNKRNTNQGQLQIDGLGVEIEYDVKPIVTLSASKAVQEPTQPLDVKIFDDKNQLVVHYPSHFNMPLTTPLPEGRYTICAKSASIPTNATFDTPLYSGTQAFTIKAAEVTKITLTCTQSTSSVRIYYSDIFRKLYPALKYRYYTVLSSSLGDKINVPSTEIRAAHFNITTPDVMIYGQVMMEELQKDGTWLNIWVNDPAKPDDNKEKVFVINPNQHEGIKPSKHIDFTITI
ncbi:MAG: DUF4493 domain-containing protein [Mucinivorans sp.]